MKAFFDVAADSDFSIVNLPYGVATTPSDPRSRVFVAIGDLALDLAVLEEAGLIQTEAKGTVFVHQKLQAFAKLGKKSWVSVREQIQKLLTGEVSKLKENSSLLSRCLIPQSELKLELPFDIGGFTDFYSSEYHATNVGRMFRGDANALLPNWKHIPIAYNGRASTVVIDGTAVRRPNGQIKKPDVAPEFGPSQKLDFELELGVFVGKENALGEPLRFSDLEDALFGMVLVNDWSARDIQSWEYQPLGPFLGKSFATTISPWVVPFLALEPAKRPLKEQTPAVLPYLKGAHVNFDIELAAELKPAGSNESFTICKSNLTNMYWSFGQQLIHHASNGCIMEVGDLIASGTLSGPDSSSWASLLELSMDGKRPLSLGQVSRSFLEDGDEIILRAFSGSLGHRIGFGKAGGKILPALPYSF
jgi:fumarylacetoacetase